MNVRILVVDDISGANPFSATKLAVEAEFGGVELIHFNPTEYSDNDKLLSAVQEQAKQYWDVILVDINLRDDRDEGKQIELSLTVIERVRTENSVTALFLFSGTLVKEIQKAIKSDETTKKKQPEILIKRLLDADIDNFVSRSDLTNAILEALRIPSAALQIDRLLMENASLVSKCKEGIFDGKSFSDLACSIRSNDDRGQELLSLIVNYGVASILDLNI